MKGFYFAGHRLPSPNHPLETDCLLLSLSAEQPVRCESFQMLPLVSKKSTHNVVPSSSSPLGLRHKTEEEFRTGDVEGGLNAKMKKKWLRIYTMEECESIPGQKRGHVSPVLGCWRIELASIRYSIKTAYQIRCVVHTVHIRSVGLLRLPVICAVDCA